LHTKYAQNIGFTIVALIGLGRHTTGSCVVGSVIPDRGLLIIS